MEANKTPKRPQGQAKILKTREKILFALNDLLAEGMPARKLSWALICRRAGVSQDPLYESYNSEFKFELERKIAEAAKSQGGTKRRRLPISMTAEQLIDRLKEQNEQLKADLNDAANVINVLAQIVEKLAAERGNVVELPMEKLLLRDPGKGNRA